VIPLRDQILQELQRVITTPTSFAAAYTRIEESTDYFGKTDLQLCAPQCLVRLEFDVCKAAQSVCPWHSRIRPRPVR